MMHDLIKITVKLQCSFAPHLPNKNADKLECLTFCITCMTSRGPLDLYYTLFDIS